MKPTPAASSVHFGGGAPGLRDIQAQLARILTSSFFSRSKVRTRFLSLIVQRTLEGTASELKEYLLGVEALGRQETFDPRLDPAVRVNATHVRSKLAEYYAGHGSSDPVRIDLPSGAYVPTFSWNMPTGLPDASIAVLPCTPLEINERDELFADGITEELINALAQEPGIKVVARTSAWAFKGRTIDVREIGRLLKVRTVLESTLRTDGDLLRISARLSDTTTGYTLWSQNFDAGCDDALVVQEQLAAAIVDALKPQLHPAVPRTSAARRPNPGEYEQWARAK